jgi:hypothetical protein
LFIHHFQHLSQDILDQLVLECRDAYRPLLLTLFLGYMLSKDRLVAIPHGPQPLVQVPKILFQLLPILLLRDAVHPYCCLTPLPPKGSFQSLSINEVGERVELGFGFSPRSFRYLPKFR